VASSIDARTKIVAVGAASNLLGTVNDFVRVVAAARAVGAVSYVDAVHLAPHALIDVEAIGCDMLVCSPYKVSRSLLTLVGLFSRSLLTLVDVEAIGCDMLVCSPCKFFGPHVGMLFVRRPLALRLSPYKLRPSSDALPGYSNCQVHNVLPMCC
jgi:selenocysteine lyase/cysteine desulfurase